MQRPAVLDHFSSLADATRARILLVLARHELAVSELCAVLQLPQSTVSRHLKVLADDGWVGSRPEGTSRVYRMAQADLTPTARRLWHLTREEISTNPATAHDLRRLESVLIRRRGRSREFFASTADQWDRLRDELYGPQTHLLALAGLLPESWHIADLGCGTGAVAESLAPFVRKVVAVDGSAQMLDAASARLTRFDNVEVRGGELESLPLGDGEFDAATLILVLHHLPDPGRVLSEVARILRPGGRLLIADMQPHDRQDYRLQMGHVWLGFAEDHLGRLIEHAGMRLTGRHLLPIDPQAKGPELFVATAISAA